MLKLRIIKITLLYVILFSASACKKDSVFLEHPKSELLIKANNPRLKAKIIHFFKDTVYVIPESITIDSGQIFKLDAGTLVKVNSKNSITIKSGGKIEAHGTQPEPIVFTLNVYTGVGGNPSGDDARLNWRGIWIYGSQVSPNSGTLSYVRIEFAGAGAASLNLNNVGNKTILNNIQVSYSIGPAFEFNGGNPDAHNLVAYATYKSDFVLNNGYKGKLQNVLAFKHPYSFFGNENGGLILRGSETFPIISNVTVIGPNNNSGLVFSNQGSPNAGIIATDSAKFHIRNSAVFGFPIGGFQLNSGQSAFSLEHGESSIMNSIFHSNNASRTFYLPTGVYGTNTSAHLKDFLLLKPELDNRQYMNSSEFILKAPFDYYGTNSPDPSPASDSPLLNGANFDGTVFSDPFFKKVKYRGALGAGEDNWLQGWTNFIPLQTNYNF